MATGGGRNARVGQFTAGADGATTRRSGDMSQVTVGNHFGIAGATGFSDLLSAIGCQPGVQASVSPGAVLAPDLRNHSRRNGSRVNLQGGGGIVDVPGSASAALMAAIAALTLLRRQRPALERGERLRAGRRQGRNPDALFDTSYYLQRNPDVKAAGVDPLLHCERNGWKEGRDPSAQFSTSKCLAANADVKAAGANPLVHYEQHGMREGRPIFHA